MSITVLLSFLLFMVLLSRLPTTKLKMTRTPHKTVSFSAEEA